MKRRDKNTGQLKASSDGLLAYTCMENKNNFTEEASFYSGKCLFDSVQQWH